MDFTARLDKLNDAQKQAVTTIEGPVMVIAGPGTGKTELLSMRVANILATTDTLPENILCLTFTESGANTMRERLTEIIGPSAYKVAIHTFHSFGTEIINQNGNYFYHGANFRASDELVSYELLRSIFDELDYNNPLAGKMNDEYTYLRDTLTTISELKKSGLTNDELLTVLDANDKVIEVSEPLIARVFGTRVAKSAVSQIPPIIKQIKKVDGTIELPGITPLSRVLADSLAEAVSEAETTNSTKPISKWRTDWMKRNDAGELIFKARDRQTKLRAVSYIYYQYLVRMQQAELYDFDDMILRVVHAMEVFADLRLNLQEKYQYIMVDEFQDTNMAQMRILYSLTNNEIHNGRPNILVVGDDDQAIYSFQGADVSNITSFRDMFDQTQLITLTDNYRSTDTVLSHARHVINLGADRLENHIPNLDKQLTAHRPNTNTSVALVELPTRSSEYRWVAHLVADSIKSGTPPSEIAILARRHHEIMELLPYLAKEDIRVNYERRDNVLDLEIIKLIEHIAQIIVALFEQRHDDADSLLPELLAHPAFGVSAIDVWRLSVQGSLHHQSWMEIMAVTPKFTPLHTWLVNQAQALAYTPLERMLDEIIGTPESNQIAGAFVSPVYNHYFSPEQLEKSPDNYLTCLEALRTIRTKLVEYQPQETPTLQSLLEFLRLHKELGSTITNVRPQIDHFNDRINVMTAHKSKGLEFEEVYIVGAVDSTWGERVRSRNRLIGYPENLPLAPVGDTFDERLRLFFVAMTRAKRQLTISYATSSDDGKRLLRASFLTGDKWQVTTPPISTTIETLTESAQIMWYQPLIRPIEKSMHELLAPHLEHYKLSSTHLNSFLDISRGGPEAFLINNLLRFPQAASPSASYGLAIHATLQRAHMHLTATGHHRPIEDILHDFEENLKNQYLKKDDFRIYLQKGTDTLSAFLSTKYNDFTPTQKTELNFSNQSVFIGQAHLTGSLDLVDINDGTITVTDYKTGKPTRNWVGKTDYEKIKLHKYRQQLMFYNLLVNNSRDYGRFTFAKGILQFVEPTPRGEIIALEATFAKEDLQQFSELIQQIWKHITTLNLPDTSNYSPSYKGMLDFESDLIEGKI